MGVSNRSNEGQSEAARLAFAGNIYATNVRFMLESTIMTMTIELAPEIEKLLQIEAERKGLSPHKIVQIVLEEKFSRQKHSKQDLWQKLFAEGLITHIPNGISDEEDDFAPIEIAGEPMSETIIRERR